MHLFDMHTHHSTIGGHGYPNQIARRGQNTSVAGIYGSPHSFQGSVALLLTQHP